MSIELNQTADSLRHERKELFMDVVKRRKKPSRIPLISSDSLWKICDEGEKFSIALNDYDRLYEIMCAYHERYDFDSYTGYSARNTIPFTNALGEGMYIMGDDPNSLTVRDDFPMRGDEYGELAEKGIVKFCLENLICRLFHYKTREEDVEHLKAATPWLMKYSDYYSRVSAKFVHGYGVPKIESCGYQVSFENYSFGLRGIKETAMDLRRRPQEMLDAMEKMEEYYWPAFTSAAENLRYSDEVVFDTSTCPMNYTLLSPKQFAKFYWPWMKRYFDFVEAHDQTSYIFAEGSFANKIDFFRDIPEKRVGVLVEEDDPAFVKKALPNLTVIGGYPSMVLGQESREKNLSTVKKLVEECASDGNYIFSMDKMLSYPRDCNRENLLAVLDYLRSVTL